MNETNSTPTAEDIEVWQALDEIDKDPWIGRLTKEEQNNLFDQFFSKEAKMERLQRVRKRKQAATVELEKILAMEKQLLESLQE